MYLRSHAQKYIPGVYLHVCKLYTCVNLAHANWTLGTNPIIYCKVCNDPIFSDRQVGQTEQTQICRLLLKEQSGLGLHCLLSIAFY